MIDVNQINLDIETRRKILTALPTPPPPGQPEMSEFDSAFLCGLLRKFHPQKIVEVGVCSGGTTAIILQCLEDIGQEYKMYSIDISAKYPRDNKLETGFIGKEALESILIPKGMKGTHKFYLDTILPFVIDEIGRNIDFIILDTAHVVPGEILDFLVALPYLKDNAIVVLHDVYENQRDYRQIHQHATGLLFSAVVADKFLNFISNDPKTLRYPNIAAFQINNDTMKYIENVFLTLMIRWRYLPEENHLNGYYSKLVENYPAKLKEIFIEALKINSQHVLRELQALGKPRNYIMSR